MKRGDHRRCPKMHDTQNTGPCLQFRMKSDGNGYVITRLVRHPMRHALHLAYLGTVLMMVGGA